MKRELTLAGRTVVSVSSYALVNEVSDDTRFQKRVSGGLHQVRNLVGDGLFTVRAATGLYLSMDSHWQLDRPNPRSQTGALRVR
jgi:hypothetical protein